MVDSKGTCTSASTAGDAWADADAGVAGGAESDVTASSEVIRDNGQFRKYKAVAPHLCGL
jgi:hypothetical protein